MTSVLIGLSGCTSSLSGEQVVGEDTNENSSVCSKLEDDVKERPLLVLRPAESASEETWSDIYRVAEERSKVMGYHVYDGDVNGSRAIVVPGPSSVGRPFEEGKRLFLSETTFSVYLGTEESMTEVANDSMEVTTGASRNRSDMEYVSGDMWDVPMVLGETGEQRVRSVVENTTGELQSKTVVNGEVVDQRPMPRTFRHEVKEGYDGEFLAFVPDGMMADEVMYAARWPSFPVEMNVSRHRCGDESEGKSRTTSTTEAQTDGEFPDGFDETGYTDPQHALQGHVQALSRTSFTSTTTLEGETTVRILGNPETNRVYKEIRENGEITGRFFYDDGSVRNRGPFYADVNSFERAIVFDGQYEGISGVDLENPQIVQNGESTLITYEVVDGGYSGELTVREDGLMTRYTLEKIAEDGALPNREYRVTNIGETTVETPEWA